MSDDLPSLTDLSNLEQDLIQALQPSWVKDDDDDHTERMARLAQEGRGADDPAPNRDRRGHGQNRFSQNGPRRDGGGGSGGTGQRRNDSGARPERRNFDASGQQPRRREGSGAPREGRSFDRRNFHSRPEPAPVLEGWTVTIQPEISGIEAVAKQIRAQAKAYALFDLARLVLSKPERFLVQFQSEGGPALWQNKESGGLWLSENEVVQQILGNQVERWYRKDRITVDPPKGAYPFIAKCGLSGVLLGPPNFHNYQTRLRQLHAEKYPNLAFEAYKGRITMVRDEASIQQWKEEQSTKEVYFPLEVAEGTEAPRLDTWAEVERHFRAHYAEQLVQKVGPTCTVSGLAVMKSSATLVRSLTQRLLDELVRFPLPLVHVLSRELESRGLNVFRAHQNITYVSVARPRSLDRTQTVVSDAVRTLLEYLESHAQTPRAEQWKALIELRPAPAADAPDLRESALASDLNWLLREGHVIDFAKHGLELAATAKNRVNPKNQPARNPSQNAPRRDGPPKKQNQPKKPAPPIAPTASEVETAHAEVEISAAAVNVSSEPSALEVETGVDRLPTDPPVVPPVSAPIDEPAPVLTPPISSTSTVPAPSGSPLAAPASAQQTSDHAVESPHAPVSSPASVRVEETVLPDSTDPKPISPVSKHTPED